MKKISFYTGIAILMYLGSIFSQSISPYVINTIGGGGTTGGIEMYYNIGEVLVSTISNTANIITQGFLQPAYGAFKLFMNGTVSNVSCIGKNDGSIVIQKYHTGITPQSLSYQIFWSDTSLCPANDCDALYNLSPGTYSVMIVAYNGSNPIDTVTQSFIIDASTEPCKIKVFTYISPNNDGQNDYFYIENIEEYPDNLVQIFNRWGQLIAEIKNYDNQENAWGSKKYPITVPGGTYYYLIDLNGKGKDLVKGFMELIK